MLDELERVAQDPVESRSEDTSNAFGEAFELLGKQPFSSNESFDPGSQDAINAEFGTLELFDITNDTRTPTFERGNKQRDVPLRPAEVLDQTIKELPEAFARQGREFERVFSDPGAVIKDAAENAERLFKF